jgi:hypothetical protein
MAQIGIQEKKANIWPWVLLALLAAVLLWWFMSRRGTDLDVGDRRVDTTSVAAARPDAAPGAATSAGVTGFLAHVERTGDGSMALDHSYTAGGLRQLAAALEDINGRGADAVAGGSGDLAPQLQLLRQHADSLEQNARSEQHARHAREGMMAGARAMQMVQGRAPAAEEHVSAATRSAQEVRAGSALQQQREAVKQYFDHAGAAVRELSRARGA